MVSMSLIGIIVTSVSFVLLILATFMSHWYSGEILTVEFNGGLFEDVNPGFVKTVRVFIILSDLLLLAAIILSVLFMCAMKDKTLLGLLSAIMCIVAALLTILAWIIFAADLDVGSVSTCFIFAIISSVLDVVAAVFLFKGRDAGAS